MAAKSVVVTDFRRQIPGEVVGATWEFPVVRSMNAHGRNTEWQAKVRVFRYSPDIELPNVPAGAFLPFDQTYLDNAPLAADIRAWINIESRVEGGKTRATVPTIVHCGKNIGKASATNVVCQALRDALGLYNKQVKKSAVGVGPGVGAGVGAEAGAQAGAPTERYPPMLAQLLRDQKKPPKFGEQTLFLQRKYNGVRAVTTLDNVDGRPTVIMYSRRKNLYPGFGYIKRDLRDVLQRYWDSGRRLYLDGEVYAHGVALQDISGQARREFSPEEEALLPHYVYMLYDCFIANEPGLTYSERSDILKDVFGGGGVAPFKYVMPVETFRVDTEESMKKLYDGFVAQGYEGAMLRLDVPYEYSYNERHSKSLLKIKPRLDAEFEIVKWTTGGKGKAADAFMVVCRTADGREFPVTPALELAERQRMTQQMGEMAENQTYFDAKLKGRQLIVYFDEWSKDMVPQRATTKMEIRTWE